MHKLKKLLENRFLCFKEIPRSHSTYFFERKKNQSHSAETMELNIMPATLLDQQKSHEPTAHRTFSQVREIQSVMPLFYLLALKEIKRTLVVKRMQTKLFFFFFFFITQITSYSRLAKTILFNCLISPSHYSIQYFLYWRRAAYGAQLYRSVLVMVRHACAEKRRRGRAAMHSLRVRCGFLSRPGNDSREISFHDSLLCLQKRIDEGTS